MLFLNDLRIEISIVFDQYRKKIIEITFLPYLPRLFGILFKDISGQTLVIEHDTDVGFTSPIKYIHIVLTHLKEAYVGK